MLRPWHEAPPFRRRCSASQRSAHAGSSRAASARGWGSKGRLAAPRKAQFYPRKRVTLVSLLSADPGGHGRPYNVSCLTLRPMRERAEAQRPQRLRVGTREVRVPLLGSVREALQVGRATWRFHLQQVSDLGAKNRDGVRATTWGGSAQATACPLAPAGHPNLAQSKCPSGRRPSRCRPSVLRRIATSRANPAWQRIEVLF